MKIETENESNDREEIQENILYAESIFGHNTRRRLVRLSYGITFDVMISPEEARFFAMSVMEAAQAAETDEILMSWLHNTVGVKSDEEKAAILIDFRNIRTEMRRRELEEARRSGTQNNL